jgi:hypothetical protein
MCKILSGMFARFPIRGYIERKYLARLPRNMPSKVIYISIYLKVKTSPVPKADFTIYLR